MSPSIASTVASRCRTIPSFGFSGAGFMTCYHFGVAHCLVKNGMLPPSSKERGPIDNESNSNERVSTSSSSSSLQTPVLTGVSGGALVAAATSLGMDIEDCMDAVLEIAHRTRLAGGVLDALRPGFSLIDEVEDIAQKLAAPIDTESEIRRINNGRFLRIGLTDRRYFVPAWFSRYSSSGLEKNPSSQSKRHAAYVYVDQFRDFDDVLAAMVLSSYIPGITGPALGRLQPSLSLFSQITNGARTGAVRRSHQRLMEMVELGFVKTADGRPIVIDKHDIDFDDDNQRELFWDGGLANTFPIIDEHTCVVSPFVGNFVNPSISPMTFTSKRQTLGYSWPEFPTPSTASTHLSPVAKFFERKQISVDFSDQVQLYVCLENAETVRRVSFSSEDNILQQRFEHGYNDAHQFLMEKNMLDSSRIPIYIETSAKSNEASQSVASLSRPPSKMPLPSTPLPFEKTF